MYNILVCDDDREIVDAIEIYLTQEGYHVLKAYDGMQAIQMLEREEIQLLIIDVMMPKLDGIRATLKIREKSSIPIIILSAKSEDVDKILGLNIGADDYVTKPFENSVLLARVKARLRRQEPESETLRIADLTVDLKGHQVLRDGKDLRLTPLEFDLLSVLARKPWQVFSREELLEQVWGYRHNSADTRLVNVHIQRLRSKVEKDPDHPEVVVTIRGVGYRAGAVQE